MSSVTAHTVQRLYGNPGLTYRKKTQDAYVWNFHTRETEDGFIHAEQHLCKHVPDGARGAHLPFFPLTSSVNPPAS